MRKKRIDTIVKRYRDDDEHYLIIFKTHNELLEAKVDKENLRLMIETIDNEIL
jgi:hypothetical protein